MDKKINIAQVGVGYWGPNLLRNLVANEGVDVVVVEPSEERRQFVQNLYSEIPLYDNIDAVLDNSDIDALVISTPAGTHFELAKKTLHAGKHILVEKPLATKVDEVLKLKEIASEKNLVVMSGHTFLFNSAVRYLKQIIDDGELGEIRYIYSQRLNLGRIRSDIDAMWNLAPHDISIIQYLMDDLKPVSVEKQGMDFIQRGIDDVVFMNLVYPSSVMANIHISWLDPNKVRKMTVVGSKKMAVYDDMAEKKIAVYDKGIDTVPSLGQEMDFDDKHFYEFEYRNGEPFYPEIKFVEPLKNEIAHFLDCISIREKCFTGIDHSVNVIDILERATYS